MVVRESISIDFAAPGFPCPGAPGGVARRVSVHRPRGRDAIERFKICWDLRGIDGFWPLVVDSLTNPENELCFAEAVDADGKVLRFAMRDEIWQAIFRVRPFGPLMCQKITSEFASLI
jgi:hypothetical protein